MFTHLTWISSAVFWLPPCSLLLLRLLFLTATVCMYVCMSIARLVWWCLLPVPVLFFLLYVPIWLPGSQFVPTSEWGVLQHGSYDVDMCVRVVASFLLLLLQVFLVQFKAQLPRLCGEPRCIYFRYLLISQSSKFVMFLFQFLVCVCLLQDFRMIPFLL